MKRTMWVAAMIGLALLIALVVREGAASIAASLATGGWWLLAVLPLHALPLILDSRGWLRLLEPYRDPRSPGLWPYLFWVACIREAVNRLLPTANVGGELVGIRLARLRIADTVGVTASVVLEVVLTLVNQYILSGLGIVLILLAHPHVDAAWAIAIGLVLSLPIPIGLGWLLRSGKLFGRLHGLAQKLLGEAHRYLARMDGDRLDGEIKKGFSDPKRLIVAAAWQLAGLLLGSTETALVLALLGHPVTWTVAVGVEALTQGVRNMVFFVPGGLGIQEAAVMLFAQLVGVGPEVGLSLALVKRAREIAFGVPALLSWQWHEARRIQAPAPDAEPEPAPSR